MSGAKPKPRRWLLALPVLLALLAWAWLCPSYLGEALVEHALLNALNDPDAGLSCESVEAEFSYLQLLRERRLKRLDARGIRMDLSKSLAALPPELLAQRDIRLDLSVAADLDARGSGMDIRVSGRALDWPLAVDGHVDVALSDLITASGGLRMDQLSVGFSVSPFEWTATLDLPKLGFSHDDALLADLVGRLPMGAVTNLTFGGELTASAVARKTRKLPVPSWEAKVRLSRLSAAAEIGDNRADVGDLSLSLSAEGVADRVYLHPAMLRMRSAGFGALSLANVFASACKNRNEIMVSEVGAECCGGRISLYSLRLNPESLNAGFTLFFDDIDTGKLLSYIPGFRGEASGRLHGKLPLFVRDGLKVRLRDAFLYSVPGETGTLRISDSSAVVENLQSSGVSPEACDNLTKALANLVYSVLKIRLTMEDRENAALTLKIDGSSTHGGTTVPVTFEVTFHGALEQLFNLGLRTASMKGK